MIRRRFLLHLVTSSAGLSCAGAARAQGFPTRTIQLVVPYPAGGPTDRVCRIVAEVVAAKLGQPVVILNQPGAAGTLGIVNSVLPARPDGYTLGLYTGGMLRVPALQATSWHPINDFSFVAGLLQSTGHDMGLLVRTDSPYRSFADFRDAALRDPGKLSFGSAGVGSGVHLVTEQLADAAGIQLTHIPYKGSAELAPAVLGGHVAAIADLAGGWEKLVEDGRLRLLLTFGERPSGRWPQVPTAKSLGFPVLGTYTMGIVGPAAMDRSVVDALRAAIATTASDSRFVATLQQQHQLPWPTDASAYKAWNVEQFERERAVIRRLGIGPG